MMKINILKKERMNDESKLEKEKRKKERKKETIVIMLNDKKTTYKEIYFKK